MPMCPLKVFRLQTLKLSVKSVAQVICGSDIVTIDRANAQKEIYSIRFQADRLGGRGADNVFFAPYTECENNSVNMQRLDALYRQCVKPGAFHLNLQHFSS
jgi:hypothetical protein